MILLKVVLFLVLVALMRMLSSPVVDDHPVVRVLIATLACLDCTMFYMVSMLVRIRDASREQD